MISSLTLSNVALIKKQTIDFKKGFNCLLGQSGAGKSIVIDALSFSLGAKSDKLLIRSGETLMRVDAVFSDLSEEVKRLLKNLEIDFEDEIILSRTLNVEGKSSIKLNGFPITLKTLQTLAEKLADFCGQHDSVGLLNANNHLLFLDKFAGEEVENLKQQASQLFDEVKEIEKQIASLGGDDAQRAREKDLLEYQIAEIENAQLQVGEEEELKERFNFISSSEKIFDKTNSVLSKLDEQRENVTALLYECKNELSGLGDFKDIADCQQRLENTYYEIKDVVDVLESVKQSTEFDPAELERIDARLDLIKSLSKKYGKGIEAILDFCMQCQERLDALNSSVQILKKLQADKLGVQQKLESVCQRLSERRKQAALKFEQQITNQLAELEMKGTSFKVDFQQTECSRKGCDAVKFMFSANRGQEIRDLSKTASGGELSRLLLAFKNVMLGQELVQTVVFDEIDAGISGLTAGKVAEKLCNLAKFTQIICITHTPVVASMADNFLLVEKKVENENTISTVTELDIEGTIREVASLIDGGDKVGETAIMHAKKLLKL